MWLGRAYLDDLVFSFAKQKQQAEQAFRQLSDGEFFRQPGERSNSVAVIVKHLGGNLKSRWTDFLISDGDKPWRDRDAEFVIGPDDTRERLLAAWEEGWAALFGALAGLREEDLLKRVTIRGEAHTVLQAADRAVTHAAYHAGQILYVARLVKEGDWEWITVPPGQSAAVKARGGNYLKGAGDTGGQRMTGAKSLYERLGGVYAIAAVVDDFIDRIMDDPRLNANPAVQEAHHRVSRAGFKYLVTEQVCHATGGPQRYTGRSMHDSHAHLGITAAEWQAFLDDLRQTFDKFGVPSAERQELLAIVESTRKDIVMRE
jgi:hemoglobin